MALQARKQIMPRFAAAGLIEMDQTRKLLQHQHDYKQQYDHAAWEFDRSAAKHMCLRNA